MAPLSQRERGGEGETMAMRHRRLERQTRLRPPPTPLTGGRAGTPEAYGLMLDRPRAPISGVAASGSLPDRRPEPDLNFSVHPALHRWYTLSAQT